MNLGPKACVFEVFNFSIFENLGGFLRSAILFLINWVTTQRVTGMFKTALRVDKKSGSIGHACDKCDLL